MDTARSASLARKILSRCWSGPNNPSGGISPLIRGICESETDEENSSRVGVIVDKFATCEAGTYVTPGTQLALEANVEDARGELCGLEPEIL